MKIKPEQKMYLVNQVDPNLPVNINKFGCRFMSLLGIAQYYLRKALSVDQILHIYDECVKMGPDVIKKDCSCGPREDVIVKMGFEMLGDTDHYAYQICTSDNPEKIKSPSFLPSGKNKLYFIFDIRTSSSAEYGGKHFLLADANGIPIYDPGAGSVDKSVKHFGKWLCYKVFSETEQNEKYK